MDLRIVGALCCRGLIKEWKRIHFAPVFALKYQARTFKVRNTNVTFSISEFDLFLLTVLEFSLIPNKSNAKIILLGH
jgi:hypothetical protein